MVKNFISDKATGKSLEHLAYEIPDFAKGFLAKAYEIFDFIIEISRDFKRVIYPSGQRRRGERLILSRGGMINAEGLIYSLEISGNPY